MATKRFADNPHAELDGSEIIPLQAGTGDFRTTAAAIAALNEPLISDAITIAADAHRTAAEMELRIGALESAESDPLVEAIRDQLTELRERVASLETVVVTPEPTPEPEPEPEPVPSDIPVVGDSSFAVEGVEVGAVTANDAVVAYDLSAVPATSRVLVSRSENLQAPIYGAAATGTTTVKSAVSGLQPDSQYHWGVEVDGVLLASPRGKFRTSYPVGAPASFNVAVGSCGGNGSSPFITGAISNSPAYLAIKDKAPLFLLDMGDERYNDYSGTDLATRVGYRKTCRNIPRRRVMNLALWRMFNHDDHDGCGNNWGGTSAGVPSMLQAYTQTFPHFPLVPGTMAQQQQIGRVHFITLDPRSARVGSTILGATQMAWLQDLLASTVARLVVMSTSLPWIGAGSTGSDSSDNWQHWPDDRAKVAKAINGYEARTGGRVILVAGDSHMIAMDDGTNSQYDPDYIGAKLGPPVYQFAPYDASNSVKGGPYSLGQFTNNRYQFGMLRITDDGSTVTVVAEGHQVNVSNPDAPTTTIAITNTVVIPPGIGVQPAPAPPVVTIANAAAVTEGGTLQYVVTASKVASKDLVIPVSYSGTASTADHTGPASVTIKAGQLTATLLVPTVDDTTEEGDETVIATLGSGTTYTLGTSTAGTGVISSNDTPVVTVPGAFNPASIDSLSLWFDANDPATISTENAQVTGWASKVGAAVAVPADTTTATRPTINSDYRNGQRALHFDGVKNRLLVNNRPSPESQTMIAVATHLIGDPLPNSDSQILLASKPSGSANQGWAIYQKDYSGTTESVHRLTLGGTGVNTFLLRKDGSTADSARSIAKDEAYIVDASFGAGGLATNTTIAIGGYVNDNSRANCDIAEVLIFNGVLSNPLRQQVSQYLADKYNIPFTFVS